jgi:hypothetical protein
MIAYALNLWMGAFGQDGNPIPDIGGQLRAVGGFQLAADGTIQLRADGTEFSTLPSMLFANPNNAVFAAMINNQGF